MVIWLGLQVPHSDEDESSPPCEWEGGTDEREDKKEEVLALRAGWKRRVVYDDEVEVKSGEALTANLLLFLQLVVVVGMLLLLLLLLLLHLFFASSSAVPEAVKELAMSSHSKSFSEAVVPLSIGRKSGCVHFLLFLRAVPNSTIGGQINTTFLVEFLLNCGIRGRC